MSDASKWQAWREQRGTRNVLGALGAARAAVAKPPATGEDTVSCTCGDCPACEAEAHYAEVERLESRRQGFGGCDRRAIAYAEADAAARLESAKQRLWVAQREEQAAMARLRMCERSERWARTLTWGALGLAGGLLGGAGDLGFVVAGLLGLGAAVGGQFVAWCVKGGDRR